MVCERHEEMVDKLCDHEDRIKFLELSDAKTTTEIQNLIEQVARLVSTMERFMSYAWKGLVAVAGIGMGFIIWYIQSK